MNLSDEVNGISRILIGARNFAISAVVGATMFASGAMASSVQTAISPQLPSIQDGSLQYALQRGTYCGDSEIVLSVLKEQLNLPFELKRWSLTHVSFIGPQEVFGKVDSNCGAGVKNPKNYIPMHNLLARFVMDYKKLNASVDYSGTHFKITVDFRPYENRQIEFVSQYRIEDYKQF